VPVSPDERTRDFNPYMAAAASAGFEYLLVCNAHLVARPFSRDMVVVAESLHFALLKAKGRGDSLFHRQ
jgi:hypothetical protein